MQTVATNPQRLLTCPACQYRFVYGDFLGRRACPSCGISLSFSIPYRIVLASVALAMFIYISYKAVINPNVILSIIGLILVAPFALLIRLLFIANVPAHLQAVGIAKCPVCSGTLTRAVIRPGPFDCPHCMKQIRATHSSMYRWARIGICAAFAVAAARLKGFDWSFLIFVVSLYALPSLVLWDILALDLFPPIRFETNRSTFQTLGIGRD